MFDRIFVINLDRRPDRWREFWQRLPADMPLGVLDRFPAIDGTKCEIPEWFKGPVGAYGCLLTHVNIWAIQQQQRLDSVLVLEDDAVFSRDAASVIRETIEIVPDDWDQIYFGGQYLNTNDRPPEVVIHDKLVRCRAVNRTHAYAMRLPFAQVCLDHVDKQPWPANPRLHHVDYRLEELHDSHHVYAPWRFCVGQSRGTSDVRQTGKRPARVVEHWWNQYPIVEPAEVR